MTASDALRAFITPLLPGWRVQFGKWVDDKKTDRYAVIRPHGGLPAELIRQPQFSIMLIGAAMDPAQVPSEGADAVIEAMRLSAGGLVFMQPSEPIFWSTDDGRPVSEFAVSTIST